MVSSFLSQAVSFGLAAVATLDIVTGIGTLATAPVEGSLLAQTPAASQVQLVRAGAAIQTLRG